MTQALAEFDGATPDELALIARGIQDYISNDDEHALGVVAAKLNERPGLIRRLFPTALEKEEQRVTVEKLRSVTNSNEALLKVYTDIRLDIVQRQGLALIQSVGMHLQGQLTAYATAEIGRITLTLGQSRSSFMKAITAQSAEVEQYRDQPELYEAAVESIRNQLAIYFATVKELLDGFVASLKSRAVASQQ